jgi:phage-related holin
LLWGNGTGVNGCTECVICEYFYGEMELGLTVVLNVCVVNIVTGKGNWFNGCTECVICEYCYGERELGLTVLLNVCVL